MENELRSVVDTLPGVIWTARPDGSVDFVNHAWCDFTGLDAERSCGTGWHVAIHRDDLALMLARSPSRDAPAESREMEARVRRHDGEYRRFLFRAAPRVDAHGHVTGWCGTGTDIEDRKREEDATRERERRFQQVVDGLPTIVTILSAAGEFEHANRHMLAYLGVGSRHDLNGRALGHSFHPDDREAVLERWWQCVKSGDAFDYEFRMRRRDGVYRWFHTLGFPLRDDEGRILRWYLLQNDVDDRKRAEGLLAGEKHLLELAARGHDMTEILNAICRLVESTVTGSRCSVVLVDGTGERLEHCVAPSLPASFAHAINGRPVNAESGPCAMAVYLKGQVVAPDLATETRWATYSWSTMAMSYGLSACWSTPIVSTADKVLGAFALYYTEPRAPTAADYALIEQFTHLAAIAIERTQHDALLARTETALSEAQSLSHTGSFSLDPTTGAYWWSEETHRIFGTDPAGPPSFDLVRAHVHPDDLSQLDHGLECTRRGEPFSVELRFQPPDGRVKHLHVVGHSLGNDSAPTSIFVGAVRDVTDQRVSEEALGRARAELAHVARVTTLSALTASIAHELNQPLSGMITNASTGLRMLASDPPNIDGARETVRRTLRDGNRAAEVIARLRALFGRRASTMDEPVNLSDTAREIIALSQYELRRSGALLRTELAAELPVVMGDRVQLQQVILNLLLNAAEAMSRVDDRPREILVRTERDGQTRVCLSVRDAGVGLEPEGAERLFDAFYTTKSGGMGIGLAVSRTIIDGHGGRLTAAANEGPGATFSFSIPSTQI